MQKTRLFRVVVIGSILFGLVFWNPQRVFYPLRVVFGLVAEPFQSVFSVIAFHVDASWDFLVSIGTLKQDNERLVQENMRLTAENAKFIDMGKENEMLRLELGLLPRNTFDLQAVEVIGSDQRNAGNWLLINKGSSDGLREGMVVIVGQGVVVGTIDETLTHSSKVVLLTSPESVINGIDAQTEARGIVRGQYGLGIVMDTVLLTDILKPGDAVVTSGLGGDFPRGLFLGNVDTVHPSDDRLFQQAIITPLTNASKLRVVFVITGER